MICSHALYTFFRELQKNEKPASSCERVLPCRFCIIFIHDVSYECGVNGPFHSQSKVSSSMMKWNLIPHNASSRDIQQCTWLDLILYHRLSNKIRQFKISKRKWNATTDHGINRIIFTHQNCSFYYCNKMRLLAWSYDVKTASRMIIHMSLVCQPCGSYMRFCTFYQFYNS